MEHHEKLDPEHLEIHKESTLTSKATSIQTSFAVAMDPTERRSPVATYGINNSAFTVESEENLEVRTPSAKEADQTSFLELVESTDVANGINVVSNVAVVEDINGLISLSSADLTESRSVVSTDNSTVCADETFTVCAKEISAVYTEEIFTMCAEETSTVSPEEISDMSVGDISRVCADEALNVCAEELAEKNDIKTEKTGNRKKKAILYRVDERPPLIQSMLLGFQHFLTFFGSGIAPPLLLAAPLCMDQDTVAVSQLMSTAFFVDGIITFLQVTFGVRLPIIQGGSIAFLTPAIVLLKTHGDCPISITANSTAEEKGDYTAEWQSRMREVQGAVIVSSLVEIIIGFTGCISLLLRYIGPITIAPVISLLGLGVLDASVEKAGQHWSIAAITMFFLLMFSLYLKKLKVPCLGYSNGKFRIDGSMQPFSMFPIAISLILAWFVAFLLTVTDIISSDPSSYGYEARTDLKLQGIIDASWIYIPYPGQWGLPRVTVAGVGMLSAVITNVMKSPGNFYAAATMAEAPLPPVHALNRGVGMEGIGVLIAGIFGTANGTVSYSANIVVVGLTKVGSRFVIQMAALMMIIFGILGKATAFFASTPTPIVGGMFIVVFGTVLALGLSILQYVDLNSTRNLVIIGFSFYIGLAIPSWIEDNIEFIKTGVPELDQVLVVLLGTGMFVGGLVAFVLDNTVPGTVEERGIVAFNKSSSHPTDDRTQEGCSEDIYDLPFGMSQIRKWKWTRYIPFSPTFKTNRIESEDEESLCSVSQEYDDKLSFRIKSEML